MSDHQTESDYTACGRGPCWMQDGHDGPCEPGSLSDPRRPQTEIAEVLAEHQKVSWGMGAGTPDTCRCGARTMYEPGDEDVTIRRDRAFAAHQAEVLALRFPPGVRS